MSQNGPLNPQMDEAAGAIARGEHPTRLMERLDISRRTLSRWKGREDFKRRIAELRSEMVGRAMGRAADAASEGAAALQRLLRSENEGIVLGAARALLQLSGTLYVSVQHQVEIEELDRRLAEIESSQAKHSRSVR